MRHSRVREVMGLIQKVAEESPVFPAGVTKIYHLDLQTADKAFCTILETMLAKLYRDTIIALVSIERRRMINNVEPDLFC
ncbi:hypothetical protein L915_21991 [Phytophthora nicotianae]|uniref:Uncharacterized protein n=1 Tax=Phytophthora nicotianae TaxID=4792 RepID=W2FL73_PHYNI|nr:hypothetical protein L915_21991 [Phytophthora nicotianae]